MGKQVRSFYLDHEVGAEIDREAERIGPNKASALVEQLLREALAHRRSKAVVKKALVEFSEATSSLVVFVMALWAALVFI